VVHTKPRQEATAIENLQRQGYCCYMPTLLAQKVHRTQIKYVSEPMFARYVFVACDQHYGCRSAVISLALWLDRFKLTHFDKFCGTDVNRPAIDADHNARIGRNGHLACTLGGALYSR